jgi:short-subunit dehydrogenase
LYSFYIDKIRTNIYPPVMRDPARTYALVVGASTTVGAEYARQMAARGHGLAIVARRRRLLDGLADEIRAQHGVPVRALAVDLLEEGAVEKLLERTRDLDIHTLVCNANLHRVGLFEDMALETKLHMLRMNAELPMRLAHAYGPAMVARRSGELIFVNALNCMTALDFDGVFQGAKSFLLVFGESLWAEYRRHGVKVGVAMVSGIEGSESYERKLSELKRRLVKWAGASMAPSHIVAQSLEQLDRGECILIPDVAVPVNRLGYQVGVAARCLRSRSVTRMMSGFYRWLLDGDEPQAAGVHPAGRRPVTSMARERPPARVEPRLDEHRPLQPSAAPRAFQTPSASRRTLDGVGP